MKLNSNQTAALMLNRINCIDTEKVPLAIAVLIFFYAFVSCHAFTLYYVLMFAV